MRKGRCIILLAAIICLSNACKKDGSSLNNETETLSVAATTNQAQVEAEFETATGLTVVDEVPINPDDRLEFASAQEANDYFNSLFTNNTAPNSYSSLLPNLPVPEDQNCYTCKKVRVIANVPFHASILIGILEFKRQTSDLQYSFVSDFWTLTGAHFGLNTMRPIRVNMVSATKFYYEKLIEYFIGVRFRGFDFTISFWVLVTGNGDVMDTFVPGFVSPLWR